MDKYKILISDLVLDGIELKNESIYELPWQIGESYVTRGWAEKSEEPKEKQKTKSNKGENK